MAGLSGMSAICGYCQRAEPTILKWIREEDFPAKKIGGGIWESDTGLIDDWRVGQINGDVVVKPGRKSRRKKQ